MKSKLLINLLLLLLLIALGLLAWLLPGKAPETQLESLTTHRPDGVQRLLIERPDGTRLRFARQAGRWQMLEPYAMAANGVRLDALARVLEAPVLSRFPLPLDRLAEFGLDRPLRLRLEDLQLEFGGNDPINFHRYVRQGEQLALILDRFYHHLSASAEQLLSPALLPIDARLQAIDTPSYRLGHGPQGWQLTPDDPRLSADQLAERASAWSQAQGLSLQHFDAIDGLPEIGLTLESGERLVFGLRQQDGSNWLIRRDNGIGYRLPGDSPLLSPPQPAVEQGAKEQ
jgi:hypothetical protein